jgi:LDH2 family malate/lactate/ureidoglycolate dehydrogenase
LDGGNNPGYISLTRAVEVAIGKATAAGVAIIGVHNSWFSGRNAYYLEKISRAGFIGIHMASGAGQVVPTGATRATLGTNPIGFAFPRRPDPLIFDMGTAMTMWGEVLLMAMRGENFAECVGVDKDGNPTRSAAAIAEGGVIPFAGHKGYGLSLIVQAFGVLAGAKAREGSVIDSGFFFIAFDPGLLMPAEEFGRQINEMLAKIKALPRQQGVEEIRIPSERAFRERKIRRKEGVTLDRQVYEKIAAL